MDGWDTQGGQKILVFKSFRFLHWLDSSNLWQYVSMKQQQQETLGILNSVQALGIRIRVLQHLAWDLRVRACTGFSLSLEYFTSSDSPLPLPFVFPSLPQPFHFLFFSCPVAPQLLNWSLVSLPGLPILSKPLSKSLESITRIPGGNVRDGHMNLELNPRSFSKQCCDSEHSV